MNPNEARRILESYTNRGYSIKNIQEQIQMLKKKAEGNTSMDASAVSVQGGKHKVMSDYVAEYLDAEQKLKKLLAQEIMDFKDIEARIEAVESIDKKPGSILRACYINGKSVNEVAGEMHYTYRHTTRILAKGVQMFAKTDFEGMSSPSGSIRVEASMAAGKEAQ